MDEWTDKWMNGRINGWMHILWIRSHRSKRF